MATVQEIQTGGPLLPPVGPAVLARLWGVKESKVAQMVANGVIDKIGRGKFDLLKATSKYIAYLQDINSDKIKEPEKMEPKARLDWYRGNRERDAHAKDQGHLIPFDLAEQLVGAAFASVKAGLLSQHNTIASHYPEIPKDAIIGILSANRDLLKRLSEARIPESIAGALDRLTDESGAAAGQDGKPVGG